MVRLAGTGTLVVSSYGAIHAMELERGQTYRVDTGHLVSFDETMRYEVMRVAGRKSTLFNGEVIVAELTGPGHMTLQSRSQDSFLSWLIPQIPQRGSGSGGSG
jgi:uncharacterized protein (AIM24 family)